jgi:hypothetical protein
MIVRNFYPTPVHYAKDQIAYRVKNEMSRSHIEKHLQRTPVASGLPGQADQGWIVENPSRMDLALTISPGAGCGLHVVEWDNGTTVEFGVFYVAQSLRRADLHLAIPGKSHAVDLSASSVAVSASGTMMANTAWFVTGNTSGDAKEPMGWSVAPGPSPITYVTVSFAGNGPLSGDYSVTYNTGVWAGTGWAKLTGGFNVV